MITLFSYLVYWLQKTICEIRFASIRCMCWNYF
jgi:hypothetical protein